LVFVSGSFTISLEWGKDNKSNVPGCLQIVRSLKVSKPPQKRSNRGWSTNNGEHWSKKKLGMEYSGDAGNWKI
jgi:hypothetical protein